MIHLISPRLHQNKAWKSFVLIKSQRHSRGKLSPKTSPLPLYLQPNLQEAFLTLVIQAHESEGGACAAKCEARQDHGRCFPAEHRDRLSPASASQEYHISAQEYNISAQEYITSLLRNTTSLCWWCSAGIAKLTRVARPGEVTQELPGLRQPWQQEAPQEGSRVPCSAASICSRGHLAGAKCPQEWDSRYGWSEICRKVWPYLIFDDHGEHAPSDPYRKWKGMSFNKEIPLSTY